MHLAGRQRFLQIRLDVPGLWDRGIASRRSGLIGCQPNAKTCIVGAGNDPIAPFGWHVLDETRQIDDAFGSGQSADRTDGFLAGTHVDP